VKIVQYVSDYTGEDRFAVERNGRFFAWLDYNTRKQAEQAICELEAGKRPCTEDGCPGPQVLIEDEDGPEWMCLWHAR